jgi:hypothetical protein
MQGFGVLKQVAHTVTIRLKSFTAVTMVPFARVQGILHSMLRSLVYWVRCR